MTLLPLLFAVTAGAHDLWLQPSTWSPEPGTPVRVRLLLGEALKPERVRPLERDRAVSFMLGDAPASSVDGASPVFDGVVDTPTWLWLETAATTSVHGDAFFQEHLAAEGLDDMLYVRRKRRRARVEETWSRSVKVLLGAGDGPSATRPVGMELELVPQKDPATLRSGDTLPVRLLADGKPIAERWVTAWHRAPDGLLTEVKERTDADGRVDLLLPHAGGWLLRAVHMTHTDGRFRSWWTAAGLAID